MILARTASFFKKNSRSVKSLIKSKVSDFLLLKKIKYKYKSRLTSRNFLAT